MKIELNIRLTKEDNILVSNHIYKKILEHKSQYSSKIRPPKSPLINWIADYIFQEDVIDKIHIHSDCRQVLGQQELTLDRDTLNIIKDRIRFTTNLFYEKKEILTITNTQDIKNLFKRTYHKEDTSYPLQSFPSLLLTGEKMYFVSRIAQQKITTGDKKTNTMLYVKEIDIDIFKHIISLTNSTLSKAIPYNSLILNSELIINPGLKERKVIGFNERNKAWENLLNQRVNSKKVSKTGRKLRVA